ncbi:hypothetical protein BKP45_03425 [Anaerobacillus alkalidiazotrophicus]|uniref:SH3b domain-containing protein n=1 Tax=Anaerobacillus alkalidiazotrophicus TaxID=472963 RepID=A0A1S2MAJ7_9BACI|nr:N-acetylmuramoyl-L-alanine amidase [Anaerobacillus alkalidiazotrophicus]OIJ21761.1 hypothetical protein BKP45_03425 [Anaerobacillus alkalidiazotrophicus]
MRKFVLIFSVILIAMFSSIQFNSQPAKVYGDNSRVAVGEVTASLLNVRSEANANARRIAQLPRGTKVSIFEINVNRDWLKINVNNQWGFVHKDFVTITETFTQSNQVKVADGQVTASNLNVRSQASASSQRIGVLANGTKVEIFETGVNKDWLKIRINNQWGYIHSDFVRITQSNTNQSSNQVVSKGRVTATNLNVRSQASASATRLTTLPQGTQIDIYETGVNKNWLKIRVNNQWGYVHSDFVTITQGNNSQAPVSDQVMAKGQVTATNLNVRSQPNSSATRMTTLSQGTQIDVYEIGVNRDWLKIKVSNNWGYVHSDFVSMLQGNSPTPSQVIETGQVTTATLNVRSEPTTNSTRIGTLTSGTQIDIYEIGVNNDWLKIKLGNQWGYVHRNFVSIGNASQLDTSKLRNKVIVIDPGHGGNDPGAVAHGYREKDIVLNMSLHLKQKLEQAGAKVVMTRSSDVFVSLSNRTAVAKNANADIFLSIHTNSSTFESAHGTETFWNRNYERHNSEKLASSLQSKLVQNLGLRDRGVKEAGFEVIKYTQMPSVLIELGFLTNKAEAQKLASSQFQEQAAQAVLEGLLDFYK